MMRYLNLILGVGLAVSSVALLAALLFGCATAEPPTINNKECTVDLKKVCQMHLDSGQIISSQDGLPWTRERLKNAALRHLEFMVTTDQTALRCVFDTQSQRISSAELMPGSTLREINFQWAKANGFCH